MSQRWGVGGTGTEPGVCPQGAQSGRKAETGEGAVELGLAKVSNCNQRGEEDVPGDGTARIRETKEKAGVEEMVRKPSEFAQGDRERSVWRGRWKLPVEILEFKEF